jgi:hypothetical protein
MRTYRSFTICIFLAASLGAQEPAKAKKVWTNDDFPSTREAAKAVPTPQQSQGLSTPPTVAERLALRLKGVAMLRAALDKAIADVEHANTIEERHALGVKIKELNQAMEDERNMVAELESKVAAMKVKKKTTSTE